MNTVKHQRLHNHRLLYGATASNEEQRHPTESFAQADDNRKFADPGDAAVVKAPCPVSIIGQSPPITQLLSLIERFAPTDSSVLITGATGTGKELVAQALHLQSARHKAPFIDINCSAIPDSLFETELFGHQRGTFTGAHETRRGLFEAASGGTLFLDEVDALDLRAQAKLLRVLQEQCVRRVGGRGNILVNVRIVAATNRDIRTAVIEGAFRADLFFRVCVVPLHLPELYERGADDINLLIEYLLKRYAERRGTALRHFTAEAKAVLISYRWPGNVRELENTIEYALACGQAETMGLDDLPLQMRQAVAPALNAVQQIKDTASLAEVERQHILTVLENCHGNQMKAAAALDIDRRTLNRKLKIFGIVRSRGTGLNVD